MKLKKNSPYLSNLSKDLQMIVCALYSSKLWFVLKGDNYVEIFRKYIQLSRLKYKKHNSMKIIKREQKSGL